MSEHFVEYINIERYKCFSDFTAEGFRRVNLISGKNNVGKTALMEALRLSSNAKSASKLISSLASTAYQRYPLDYIEKSENIEQLEEDIKEKIFSHAGSLRVKSNLNSVSLSVDDSGFSRVFKVICNDQPVTEFKKNDLDLFHIISGEVNKNEISIFIPSIGLFTSLLIKCFTSIQKKDREQDVYRYLKSLDDTIENVKIIGGNSIQCKVIESGNISHYRDMHELGDGLRQYLTIIFALFKAEGKKIFIDELGTGIHYSSLDKLWEIILTLSKELNVQVFATTHSKECIESYCRVAEKQKDEDISFITLVKNKDRVVKAIVRDYEVFTDSIHDEREVRGW